MSSGCGGCGPASGSAILMGPPPNKTREGERLRRPKHETCVEYVSRRLREGWKIIEGEGVFVTLQSPGGILRMVDLRNDIETLYVSGAGDECNIPTQVGCSACPDHYTCVDEAGAHDGATSFVRNNLHNSTWRRDLYALDDSGVGEGTINKIIAYFVIRTGLTTIGGRIAIKSGVTVAQSPTKLPAVQGVWEAFSHEWALNPDGGGAWGSDWSVIDALQAGPNLYTGTYKILVDVDCTQVYVEVDHGAGGWTGKISGVINPSSYMGVDVADIKTVKGVA